MGLSKSMENSYYALSNKLKKGSRMLSNFANTPEISFDDLLAHLQRMSESSPTNFDLSQLGRASLVFIKIEGGQYHQSISGDLAKSLGHIQDSVYRACALALYGTDKVSVLPKTLKEKLCLQFVVAPGCTEILADLKPILRAITPEVIKKMTPKQIFGCLIAIIFLVGAYNIVSLCLSHETIRQEHATVDKAIEYLGEENKMLIENAFSKREENLRDLAKNATGANAVTFGNNRYAGEQLEHLKKSAPITEPSTVRTFDGHFVIYQINNRNPEALRLQITDTNSGVDYSVLAEKDLFQEQEDIDLLWFYARNHQTLKMQITESKKPHTTIYRLESIDIQK